ncbi:HAD-IIIA family hydrolase [Streptomyces sp. NPDC054784]
MRFDGLFLDRDGVLIEMVVDPEHGRVDSARRPEEVRLVPGAAELVAAMNAAGIATACLTNQPGPAKGTCRMRHVEQVNAQMARLLAAATGAKLDHIGVCPHHPDGPVAPYAGRCGCRKPAPGLLTDALARLGLRQDRVVFVGDGVTDIAAGAAAGTGTLLVGPLKSYVAAELRHHRVWPDWNATAVTDVLALLRGRFTIASREEHHDVPEHPSFSDGYLARTATIARDIDATAVEAVVEDLRAVRDAGGRVFAAGNGGGAAHASHFTADIRALAGIEAYCLSDNAAEVTARTNDHGWPAGYAGSLAASRIGPGDLLFVFSVGGGSPSLSLSENLVAAVDAARAAGARVSGFLGPDGGHAARHASSCVRIPVPADAGTTYHTEGLQSVLGHLVLAHPRLSTGSPTWEQRTEAVARDRA